MEKRKQKIDAGQYVTFLDFRNLPDRKYYFGGVNLPGYKGLVKLVDVYNTERNCYKLRVEILNAQGLTGQTYSMLEDEFEEYPDVMTLNKARKIIKE